MRLERAKKEDKKRKERAKKQEALPVPTNLNEIITSSPSFKMQEEKKIKSKLSESHAIRAFASTPAKHKKKSYAISSFLGEENINPKVRRSFQILIDEIEKTKPIRTRNPSRFRRAKT